MPQMLLPMFPGEATSINPLLGFCRKDDMVYYFNGMMPIFSHAVSDLKSFRLITSQLIVNGNATQKDIVDAFGISPISVKRYVKIYRQEGPSGFFKSRKGRGSNVLTPEVLLKIQGYLTEGRSVRSICEEEECSFRCQHFYPMDFCIKVRNIFSFPMVITVYPVY